MNKFWGLVCVEKMNSSFRRSFDSSFKLSGLHFNRDIVK